MKTCRLEVLDDSYKNKAKKKDSKSLPKIISMIIFIAFVALILLKV